MWFRRTKKVVPMAVAGAEQGPIRDPLASAVNHCIITGPTGCGKSCLVRALVGRRMRSSLRAYGIRLEVMLLEGFELSRAPDRLVIARRNLLASAQEANRVERIIVLDESSAVDLSNLILPLADTTIYIVEQGLPDALKVPIVTSLGERQNVVLLAANKSTRQVGSFTTVDGDDVYRVDVALDGETQRVLEAGNPHDPYRFVRHRMGEWLETLDGPSIADGTMGRRNEPVRIH